MKEEKKGKAMTHLKNTKNITEEEEENVTSMREDILRVAVPRRLQEDLRTIGLCRGRDNLDHLIRTQMDQQGTTLRCNMEIRTITDTKEMTSEERDKEEMTLKRVTNTTKMIDQIPMINMIEINHMTNSVRLVHT